jgi:hypothetical protein
MVQGGPRRADNTGVHAAGKDAAVVADVAGGLDRFGSARTRVGEESYSRGRVACGSSQPIEAEGSLSVVGR